MEFKAERCPECGDPREPGWLAQGIARFKGIDSRLDHIIARFHKLPDGNIVVSTDQFARAVNDVDLFSRLGSMTGIGHELED